LPWSQVSDRRRVAPCRFAPVGAAAVRVAAAGLHVDDCIELGSEWGEYAQEHGDQAVRRLLHTARLLRQPDRYIERFGREAYDIAVGDCLWHVYRMIGKLGPRVYLLSVP